MSGSMPTLSGASMMPLVSESDGSNLKAHSLWLNDLTASMTDELMERVPDAGGGGGGRTNTVTGSNGITNVGDNVDADLAPTYGSSANTICQGNDSRLSDARTPTGAAGGDLTGSTYPNPTIASDAVTNAKLANMAQATVKGRAAAAGTGDPVDLTQTQLTALINAFTSALSGGVPASGGGTTNFLRADGTWAAPPGGGSTPHEEEFATDGSETPGATETFGPLNATPAGGGTADTPSGYDILVFRNGIKMKYSATPSTYNEYFYDSTNNEVDVLASGDADEYEVVYGS